MGAHVVGRGWEGSPEGGLQHVSASSSVQMFPASMSPSTPSQPVVSTVDRSAVRHGCTPQCPATLHGGCRTPQPRAGCGEGRRQQAGSSPMAV